MGYFVFDAQIALGVKRTSKAGTHKQDRSALFPRMLPPAHGCRPRLIAAGGVIWTAPLEHAIHRNRPLPLHQAEKERLFCNRRRLVGQFPHLLIIQRRELAGKLDTFLHLLHGVAPNDCRTDGQ